MAAFQQDTGTWLHRADQMVNRCSSVATRLRRKLRDMPCKQRLEANICISAALEHCACLSPSDRDKMTPERCIV